jgi:putative ABC transport system permease protein
MYCYAKVTINITEGFEVNTVSRGVRNAFRNGMRTTGIVGMLGLSIGLALSMLLAHQAVGQKIASVEKSIGNTITIAPAGIRGFSGGGDPLTTVELAKVKTAAHVTSMDTTLTDRLSADDTSLTPAIEAGSFGKRQFSIDRKNTSDTTIAPPKDEVGQTPDFSTFKLPITVVGASNPLAADSTASGSQLKLTSGKTFNGNLDAPVALVGKTLAEKNNLAVGSTFTAYSGTTFTVAGIFDAGNTFANNQVALPLPTVQRLSNQAGAVTGATVHIDSAINLDATTAAITSILGSKADVANDAAAAKATITSLESIQSVSLFSLLGAAAVAAVITLLTMVMIVRERKREIGVLKAIGSSNLRIVCQFTVEAMTLTVLGAAIGIIIGSIGATPVTKMLSNNDSTKNSTSSVATDLGASQPRLMMRAGGFGDKISNNSVTQGARNLKANVNASILLYGFGAALLIAVLGSVAAAALTAKVRPSEVMRGE